MKKTWDEYKSFSDKEINKSRGIIEDALYCYLCARYPFITFYYISSKLNIDKCVPNFIIQSAKKGYFGMILNITTKAHTITDREIAKINRDRLENYYSITANNFVEAKEALDRYLSGV